MLPFLVEYTRNMPYSVIGAIFCGDNKTRNCENRVNMTPVYMEAKHTHEQ